jgi:hypothetical protein
MIDYFLNRENLENLPPSVISADVSIELIFVPISIFFLNFVRNSAREQ